MSLFGSKSVLGVDLGTAGIKIVELSPKGDKFELQNYGIIDFLMKESAGLKLTDDVLIGGLKEILSRLQISTKEAVASISSFLTFSTVIEMPYLSEKDLEKAIPFEARKYIPIPLSEVVLDWSIINVNEPPPASNPDAKKELPRVEVFLAAVPRAEAERYKNIFLSAGLNIKALELENIALSRALIGGDSSPLAVVNLGGRSTSIIIVDKGFERASRNYELGGFEVTKALAAALGISFERAEELKKSEGLRGKSSFKEAVTPLIDMIVFEARKTMANYEETKKTKVSKIILTGGQSNMPGLKEYFSDKLGREAIIGDPLKKISFDSDLAGVMKTVGPALTVALGLAMRKI